MEGKFLVRIEQWETEVSQEKQAKIDRIKAELALLKVKIDRINTAFTDGSVDLTEFKELKNPLVIQKTDLEQQIVVLEKSKLNRLEPLKAFILEGNRAKTLAFENNGSEMKSFLKKVGSNRLLRAQTLTVTFKKPFDSLAQTTVAAKLAASDSARNSRWWRRRELNPRPKQTNQPRLHA